MGRKNDKLQQPFACSSYSFTKVFFLKAEKVESYNVKMHFYNVVKREEQAEVDFCGQIRKL